MAVKTPERGTETMKKERITLRKRGQFTLPKSFIEELNLQEGDPFEITLEEDGRITLIPLIDIPANQAWFWTEEWQKEEREVEEQLKNHQYVGPLNLEEALAHLDSLKTKESKE